MNSFKLSGWFNQACFGLFLHWGLYSILRKGGWVMYADKIPKEEYVSSVIRMAVVVLVCTVFGVSMARAAEARLAADTPAAYAAAFAERTGEWKTGLETFEGQGPRRKEISGTELGDFVNDAHTSFVVKGANLWRYAFAGDATWQDYTFETTVNIQDPAPLDGVRTGQDNVFMNYQWGREAIGSDVGLIVRYQSPDRYYMIRLSTAYQHVELWKTKGGVVCVKPFPFKAGTDYRLAVSAHGPWITLAFDGQEILKYADPVEPILAGRIGVGVRESRVAFSKASVVPLSGAPAAVPAHKPNFRLRDWVGRRYIFDGDEPVAHFSPLGTLQEVKLHPGLMPMIILDSTPPTWGCLDWILEQTRLTFGKEGETFTFAAARDDKTGRCKGFGDLALSYDPACGYVWDFRARVEVLVDGKIQKWNLNLVDICYYQSVAPATDKMPQCLANPLHCLYVRTDGKYGAYPVNAQFRNNNLANFKELIVKKGGFLGSTIDDWSFIVDLPEDNEYIYWGDYCPWALDQHFWPLYKNFETKDPSVFELASKGDVFRGHARIYAMPPARVKQIIGEGILPDERPENKRPLFAHAEPTNSFRDIVPTVAGDSKLRWLGSYAIDTSVGRNDMFSMRLDAVAGKPATARIDQVGPSYRSGPYLAKQYRIGCRVKADAFKGKVTLRMDNVVFPKNRDYTKPEAVLNVAGATDWTFVGFKTELPHVAHFWRLTIEAQGEGNVWVDDFEITPTE
jgi:hypothetical protein